MNQFDVLSIQVRLIENKVRTTAKERGIKIRRHRYSGVDATFPDGKKVHYYGWKHAYNELMNTV